MKIKNIGVIFFFSFVISYGYGQVTIIDSNTNHPISNAKIFTQGGRIITVSNLEGLISTSGLNLNRSDSIEIYHPNYISNKTTWENFNKKDLSYLIPTQFNDLPEVLISGKKAEYMILKGYYVSYQIIDSVPQSFSDGIIEYYIDLKKEKVVDERIIESRVFKNTSFIKKKRNTSFNLGANILPFNFKEEILLSDWNKYDVKENGEIIRNEKIVGKKSSGDQTDITIVYNSPENPKKRSLFGMESIIYNHTLSEKFESSTPKIKGIKSLSKYYNSSITQKGITFNYELVQDFYVLDKNFLSREKYKSLERQQENPVEIETNFWEQPFSSAIPLFLKTMFHNQLELISKNEGK